MTRTEVWPTWGGVAVDPDVIPLGSTVYIAAYDRTFIANDTGGLVIGRTLDVYGGWLTQCSAAWIVGGD
jgi:3D (Asp-Asp-Asp) domain-containing protein